MEPRLIVVPAPTALALPRSPIEETDTEPPPIVRFPVKELALLESVQLLPLVLAVTATVPAPLEIRPVISLVFVEAPETFCSVIV